jgi:photosystem II stability/assembly factor-like uncharacterized protein
MPDKTLIATDDGLVACDFERGRFTNLRRALEGTAVTAVAAQADALVAGTHTGIRRSTDGGASWVEANDGLSIGHIRWLAAHPDRTGILFAGTEPAGVFVSTDSGRSWTGRPEVESLRDAHGWWLPYSPESGCVRGFAFHGDRGYAAVEVGGVLRTDDGGATWSLAPGSSGDPQFREPAPGFIHADVHSVEVHPGSPDLVFAATNAGLYRSSDGGSTWQRINADGYTRAVWIDPQDPGHIVSGPAASVGRNGTVIETADGGETWDPMTAGLSSPWPQTMVERFHASSPDHLIAVLDDGRIAVFNRKDRRWQPGPELDASVRGITAW